MVTFHGVNTCQLKNVQTTGCFTNLPRQWRIQVVNQFPCYRIDALASTL